MNGSTATTDGLDKLLDGYEAFTASPASGGAALESLRNRARDRFVASGMPTRRLEAWKYTDVSALASVPWRHEVADAPRPSADELASVTYDEVSSARIVFVNGVFDPASSRLDDLPAGLEVAAVSDLLANDPERLATFIGTQLDADDKPFASLNTARFTDGAFIRASRGSVIANPVHVLFLVTEPAEGPLAIHARNFVVAEPSSELVVVERWVGLSDSAVVLDDVVTEITAGADAKVNHVKIQREGDETTHLASVAITQERNSSVRSTSIAVGAALARNEIDVRQVGPGTETVLNGLYAGRGNQHLDHQIRIEHGADHGTSTQLYKGILADRSTGVFNGIIHVPAHIGGTEAFQTNANLLLSDDATINTKPQLEIYADDVSCSHGATVGAIDGEQLFYLRSRGIGEELARSVLTAAFAVDVIEGIGISVIEARLHDFLSSQLSWQRLEDDES